MRTTARAASKISPIDSRVGLRAREKSLAAAGLAALAVLLLDPGAAFAVDLGYARASSQLEVARRPALYRSAALFDSNAKTAWCEGARGDGVGERVLIGFKDKVVIDELRIINGDARAGTAFKARNRVQKLVLGTDTARRVISLPDDRAPLVIKLEPLEADSLEVEVLEIYRGQGEENATCLSELTFYGQGQALAGASAAALLKQDPAGEKLAGPWYSGLKGAPERFLVLWADGTFDYSFRPIDPEEPGAELRGDYALEGEQIKVRVDGKAWEPLATKLETEAAKDGTPRSALTLSGSALDGALSREWSSVP